MKKVRCLSSMMVLCTLIACMGNPALAATESTRPGTVEGVDTYFAVTDSAYRNITVSASETVNMLVDSSTDTILLYIQPVSGTSSPTITVTGLDPNATLYKYEDEYSNESVVTTDANGQYTFVQDLVIGHGIRLTGDAFTEDENVMPWGAVSGEGVTFAVTDSDFLNVTLESTVAIKANITSVPEVITIEVAASESSPSADLTVGGLVAGATYYMYVDDLSNGVQFTADQLGRYIFTQGLAASHVIFIQTTHSTLFLNDDATGGDCASIGTWDAATKTCTLSGDVNETIQINADGITLDGNGFAIIGNGSGNGIYANGRSFVTVKNTTVRTFTYGISFFNGGDNTVRNNNLSDINYGIRIRADYPGRTYRNKVTNNSIYLSRRYARLAIDLYRAMETTVNLNSIQGINDYFNDHFGGNWDAGIYTVSVCGEIMDNEVSDFYYGMVFDSPSFCSGMVDAVKVHHNSILAEIGVRTHGNWGWSDLYNNTITGRTNGYYSGYKDNFYVYYNNFLGTAPTPVYNYQWYFDYGYVGDNYYEIYDTPAEGCYDTNYNGYCDAPFTFPAHPGLNKDNYPHTSQIPGNMPVFNQPPVADAGADQTLECVDYNATPVTLDGSGSTDPDGDQLTYAWTPFYPPVSGLSPQVDVPYGTSTITLTVDDGNGESSSDAVDVTVVDTTPPVTTISALVGTEGDNGWYVSDVTITLSASDDCTGVKEIHYTVNGVETVVPASTAVISLTEDGIYSVTYWAVDNAGNVEDAGSTSVQREVTNPVTTPTVPTLPPNTGGYYNGCIDVELTADSTASGVAAIQYSLDGETWLDFTGQFQICADGDTEISVKAKSNAGNEETPHSITIKIDQTPPEISYLLTPVPNGAGWNNSDVTVTFICTDATSGVADCPDPVTVSTEGAGQVVSGTAYDVAGNEASASVTINLDKTAPVITITGVTDGQNYLVSSPPTPGYSVTDALSGMLSESALLTGGNENGVGTYTYTVTAADIAGNTITRTVTYKVIYSFDGFQMPLGGERPYKLGSTIPVKFVLTDGIGNYVANANATLSLLQLSGSEPDGDPIDGTSNVPDSGNVFRYDLTDNQYIYNLDTNAAMSVGSWRILITLEDGEVYSFDIGVK